MFQPLHFPVDLTGDPMLYYSIHIPIVHIQYTFLLSMATLFHLIRIVKLILIATGFDELLNGEKLRAENNLNYFSWNQTKVN